MYNYLSKIAKALLITFDKFAKAELGFSPRVDRLPTHTFFLMPLDSALVLAGSEIKNLSFE